MNEIQEAMKATNKIFNDEVVGRKNTAALEQVYTADARVLPPGGPMVSGRGAIRQFWEGALEGMGVTSAVLTTVDAIPAGDGIVEIGEAALAMANGNAVVKYVVFWKQEDGRWKWHVDIWNMNS
jgi:ketosteroid isomerase-like protein